MTNTNYTISFETAKVITEKQNNGYFRFGWLFISGQYFLTSSGKPHTEEWFAEVLSESAINNDDMNYCEHVANIVGFLPMFKAKVYSMLEPV